MTTQAVAGVGAQFRRLSGSVYSSIGEVVDITGPNMSRDTIDATHLGSTSGYREFIAGLRDPGNVTFTLNFTRDAYDTLKADFESDTAQSYEIALPDTENTILDFNGLVTELPLTIPPDDRITCDVTIKITGSVTVSSGT